MQYLTSPGESCFTAPEARKLTGRINKLGYKINEIRGVWIHYTHLKQSDQYTSEVSIPSTFFVLQFGMLHAPRSSHLVLQHTDTV
jgi:hypothetical protein